MKDWRGTPIRPGQRIGLGIVTKVDEATHTFTVRRLWPSAEMVITEDLLLDGLLEVVGDDRPASQPAASFTDTFFDPDLMGPRG
ncbi:MAG: hypothetical protein HOY79_28800 [Streptomyces sp.]|nr:hypothetical protein [Streptomyces sp.]